MPKKPLTEEEVVEVGDYIEVELEESKDWITDMSEKTKDHPRNKEKLKKLEAFQRKVEKGEIKMRKRIAEGYDLITADMKKVAHITRLDRDWTEEIITDVLLGLRCPADLHLYADDFGSGEEI